EDRGCKIYPKEPTPDAFLQQSATDVFPPSRPSGSRQRARTRMFSSFASADRGAAAPDVFPLEGPSGSRRHPRTRMLPSFAAADRGAAAPDVSPLEASAARGEVPEPGCFPRSRPPRPKVLLWPAKVEKKRGRILGTAVRSGPLFSSGGKQQSKRRELG